MPIVSIILSSAEFPECGKGELLTSMSICFEQMKYILKYFVLHGK